MKDKWYIKKLRHDLDLYGHSFARYLEMFFTQIRALYGDAMLVPFLTTLTWRP